MQDSRTSKVAALTNWFSALNTAMVTQILDRRPLPEQSQQTINVATLADVYPTKMAELLTEESVASFHDMVARLQDEEPGQAFNGLMTMKPFGDTEVSLNASMAAYAFAGSLEEITQIVAYTSIMRQIRLADPSYKYSGLVDGQMELFQLDPTKVTMVDFASTMGIDALLGSDTMEAMWASLKFTEDDGTEIDLLDDDSMDLSVVLAEVAAQYAYDDVTYAGRITEHVEKLGALFTADDPMAHIMIGIVLTIDDEPRLKAMLDSLFGDGEDDGPEEHQHGDDCQHCGQDNAKQAEEEPSAG